MPSYHSYSIYVDTSVAELFEDLKADMNEEIKAVAQEGKECTKVIPSINLDLGGLAERKVELQEDLNARLVSILFGFLRLQDRLNYLKTAWLSNLFIVWFGVNQNPDSILILSYIDQNSFLSQNKMK